MAQQAALRVKAGCEDYLRHGVPGNCRLEAVKTEPPKLLKGETDLDGIERLRREGAQGAIHTIRSSCFPRACWRSRSTVTGDTRHNGCQQSDRT